MNKVQLLALLGPCDMCWNKRIHEGLKVGPPPLSKTLADLPVSSFLSLADATHGGKSLIESELEPFFFVVLWPKIVARQLEKCICDLKHQNVRVVVFMTNEDALTRAPHTMFGEMLLKTFQTGDDRRVFFWLRLLDAKSIVREGIESDFAGLLGIETLRDGGRLRRL